MWLLLLLFHLVGLVGYNLVLRKSLVAKLDKWTLATVMQTGIAIPIIFVSIISPPSLSIYDSSSIVQIIIISVLVVMLHFTNVQALQHLEAGVYSILYNLRIIFTTILGILFLNEEVVPLQIIGGLLIFLAVLTVKQKGKKETTHRGIEWGLAAAFVISFLNLFEKNLINEIGYIGYAVPVMLLATIIMWTILLASKKQISFAYFKEPRTISLMVFRSVSAYGFSLAFYAGGLLSVSSYISSLSVIIIVLLGIWLLNEKDFIKRKIAAAILAFIGLTFILLANITG